MGTRVAFMGTPGFAVPSLQALIRSPYEVVAVYAQPDRKSGRGQRVHWSQVKEIAVSQGLRLVQPESLKAGGVAGELAGSGLDLIVVAAFGQVLPPEVLAVPEFGCLNVHPSLLPRHRGSSPVATAILQADEVTGVTVMLMDAGLDTGPVLSRTEVPIGADDTAASLTDKLAERGAELLMETLPLWLEGRIRPQEQHDEQASQTTVIAKMDGEMDWRLPASELWRRARAFDLWPGCWTLWRGKRLEVKQVAPLESGESGQPGEVVALPQPAPAAVGVQTGDGILALLRVQLEGKREMSAEEFARGQRDFVGSVLF